MANNLLKATILVEAPNVQQTAAQVSTATDRMSKSLQKTGTASVTATGDLINFGRVIQDAPFGILGIANNLNPLVEGLARTAKASGGAGGAIKALGASLVGAGGLALGISLVSTGLLLFGDRLFGASAASSALQESIKKSAESLAQDAVKLTTLVGVIQNVTTSTGDREKALKAFNQEYKTYLDNLGIEEVSLKNVNDAYEKIIDSLIRQAVVKGIQDQISEAVGKTAEQIIKLEAEEEKARLERERASKSQLTALQKEEQQRKRNQAAINQYNKATSDGALAQADQSLATEVQIAQFGRLDAKIGRLKDKLLEQLSPLLNLTNQYEDLGIKLDKTTTKSDNLFDKTIAKAKEVAAFLEKNTTFVVEYQFTPLEDKEAAFKRAKEFLDKVAAQKFKFKALVFPELLLPPKADIDQQLTPLQDAFNKGILVPIKAEPEDFISGQAAKTLADFSAKFTAIGKDLFKELAARGRDPFQVTLGELDKIYQQLLKISKASLAAGGIISDTLTPAFQGLFEAILDGQSPLKGFFDSLLQSVEQLISKLISAAVQALILSAITGGKSSFGGLFSKILGFRAGGGPVQGGGSYIVGEKGPELFVPNTGGSIVPNNALGQFGRVSGGQNVNITGGVRVQGKDLILAFTQATQSQRTIK